MCVKKKKNQNGGWSVLIVNRGIQSNCCMGGNSFLVCLYVSECWACTSPVTVNERSRFLCQRMKSVFLKERLELEFFFWWIAGVTSSILPDHYWLRRFWVALWFTHLERLAWTDSWIQSRAIQCPSPWSASLTSFYLVVLRKQLFLKFVSYLSVILIASFLSFD